MEKLRRYTFSLNDTTIKVAKRYTDNLSATINTLLEKFIYDAEKGKLTEALKRYERAAQERRKRLGIFR